MSSKIFVKPNPDKAKADAKRRPGKSVTVVRDPRNGKPLPQDGAWVDNNSYWLRRLRDQDVVKTDPPKKAKATGDRKSNSSGE